MQSMSRRGFATLANLSRLPNSYTHASTQYILGRICYTPKVTVFVHAAKMHTTRKHQNAAATAAAETTTEASEQKDGLITRFEDLARNGVIHRNVIDTITKSMKLETMTSVQSQTINEAAQGIDTLGVARTGTGKTVAFLLPVIQRILQARPELEHRQRPTLDIQSIIISPTRELAEQISKEARRLVGNTGIKVGLAVGGTGRSRALQEIQRYGCNILVATPGRLNDLLSDTTSGITVPNLNSFVLDEADRLLDDGFGPAIEEIYRLFPSKLEVDRQTLMFSATMEQEVMSMVRRFMKKDFRTVRTVSPGEIQTHDKVPQHVVVMNGLENQIPALFELIKRESALERDFKAIVFFNTSAEVSLVRAIYDNSSLKEKIKIHGLEMHARLTQFYRTKTSDNFRGSKRAIMFSSDVAARGMDFPDVSHVIQMGLPKDRDTYIHRVGRTGRAGKEGEGWVLLTPWDETRYRSRLKDLPIKVDESLETASLDMSQNLAISQGVADVLSDTIQATQSVDFECKSNAFTSNLSQGQSADKSQLIDALNRRAKYGWGMDPPPAVSGSLAHKLGYSRVQHLRIGEDPRARPRAMNERKGQSIWQASRMSHGKYQDKERRRTFLPSREF